MVSDGNNILGHELRLAGYFLCSITLFMAEIIKSKMNHALGVLFMKNA